MRKDMFKVIVERPRRGADFRVNRSRLAGEDDLPSRVGMKRFRSLNRTRSKWLNENLAPLKHEQNASSLCVAKATKMHFAHVLTAPVEK